MGNRRLVLCIVAGPNGSGKTSTTDLLLKNEWTEGSVYINPDNIAQNLFGDWNSPESVLKAAEYATSQRYECLKNKVDFVFETVFSSKEKVDFVKKAHDEGFFIRFFFVCTENPEINVRRIFSRYMQGGHEVPMSKIVSRYYKSLLNAKEIIDIVDRAYIYDNSVDGQSAKLIYRTVSGKIEKKYVDNIPDWTKVILTE